MKRLFDFMHQYRQYAVFFAMAALILAMGTWIAALNRVMDMADAPSVERTLVIPDKLVERIKNAGINHYSMAFSASGDAEIEIALNNGAPLYRLEPYKLSGNRAKKAVFNVGYFGGMPEGVGQLAIKGTAAPVVTVIAKINPTEISSREFDAQVLSAVNKVVALFERDVNDEKSREATNEANKRSWQ